MSHPGYIHNPLQMFGPENGVCYLPSTRKDLWHVGFLDSHFFAT